MAVERRLGFWLFSRLAPARVAAGFAFAFVTLLLLHGGDSSRFGAATSVAAQDRAGGAPAGQDAQPSAPPSGAQEQGSAEQQPVFRAGINFVRVDAIVTDRQGRPVSDLKAADFEIQEDGKAQSIETFKLVEVSGNPAAPGDARAIRTDYDEESEAQRDDVRIFVFLLDDYHVRRGAGLTVREPLIKFIQNQLGPMDLIAVAYPLTPVSAIRLTRDHDSIIRTISQFEGRKGDYRPRNEFEERYSMYPVEIVERVRNQVSLSALEGISVRLGGLREGRKAVILVSEGYSNYVPPQLRDPIADMPGLGNPNRNRPMIAENNLSEERYQFTSNMDLDAELRDVFAAANRANVSVYALDPRGLAPFEYDIDQNIGQRTDRGMLNSTMDTLRSLADQTDGRAIVNRNDLEVGLRQVVRDSSAYYLLGYNSTQAPTDGKFHEIKVRVKRSGLDVRARKGYWALTVQDTAKALAPKKEADPGITRALASVEGPSRSRMVRTWVGMSPGEDGRTRVTMVWEPVPPTPGVERRASPARVGYVATDGGGSFQRRGKVPEEVLGVTPTATAAVKGGRAVFDAEPGALQLRLAVEDSVGRVIDTDIVEVEVPDFSEPALAMSSIAVHSVRTARELQNLNAEAEPLPVATREFRRTERLIIRYEVSGPSAQPPANECRLLNRSGQAMTTLPVQSVPNKEGMLQVDLPLASLPTGEYVLEFKSTAGDSEAKQYLGFRIVT
ncbi:MAG: VWA domain-containing protein [Vicinamibacterales bacterium]